MKRKIPSTIALAVFEAAARHGSFSRAASELCLTESAVSRQIANLENYLGIRLFSRVKQQVVLNDAGRQYSRSICKNLDEIERHTLSLMTHKGAGGVLEIAVIPTFANRWLLPRLPEFRRLHPDIALNLSEKPTPFVFRDSIFDLALHYDHPAWNGVVKVDLFEEGVVPVLNPRHFDLAQLSSPASLVHLPLLHKSIRPEAWQRWFELAGHPAPGRLDGMYFEMYGMVIEAARAGLGVGLVPRFYVQDEIARNDLTIPFDIVLKQEKRYCLVYPEYKEDSPIVQTFKNWLVNTAREYMLAADSVTKTTADTGAAETLPTLIIS